MVTAANNKTKLVIWDWNGTLLDDTAYCYNIANQMRVERDMLPLETLDSYRGLFRFPVKEYYRAMGYTFEIESYEDLSVQFVDLYAAGVHTCPLQLHTKEVLSAINDRGIPQVLLSATGADRLHYQAELFELPEYFYRVVGCDNNLAFGKADRARALLKELDVAPAQTLFIGDTDHDFEIATSLGCRCLLLKSGHQLPSHLSTLGAPMIDSLKEVLDYL